MTALTRKRPIGLPAFALLLAAASSHAFTAKDGFLAVPYTLKAGSALLIAPASFSAGLSGKASAALAVGCVALPDILVLATLASGDGANLKTRRRIAFGMEMVAAVGIQGMSFYHLKRGGRGDEVWLFILAFSVPLLFAAQVNHIPFDAEQDGRSPPEATAPAFRISFPF